MGPSAGCRVSKPDHSPVGVVKQLIRAAEQRDAKAIYELLGPRTRARLEASAAKATQDTNAKRKFTPQDMVMSAFLPIATGDWKKIKLKELSHNQSNAQVEVKGQGKNQRQVIQLTRVGEHWRIELDRPTVP